MCRTLAALCLTMILAGACPAQTTPEETPPGKISEAAVAPLTVISGDAVNRAIARAGDYLFLKQDGEAAWAGVGSFREGPSALAAYALVEGHAVYRDERIQRALAWVEENRTDDSYCIALRILACTPYYGWQHEDIAKRWKRDAARLAAQVLDGTFAAAPGGKDDGCATMRAFWTARALDVAEARGFEVPPACWEKLLRHVAVLRNKDGGWGGAAGEASNVPMTAAAVAVTWVCHFKVHAAEYLGLDRAPPLEPAADGFAWLDGHMKDFIVGALRGDDGLPVALYYLVEAASVTGRWRLGGVDVWRMAATTLLESQQGNGSWTGGASNNVATALGLRALAVGRRPVVFSHLRYGGDWNNRPLAVSNVARVTGMQLSQYFGWSIVDLADSPDAWSDARTLLITGGAAPEFTDEQVARLREHVLRGNMIVSVAEGDGRAFTQGMKKVYARMFPEYPMAPAASDDPIFTADWGISPGERASLRLSAISNGLRPLAVHCEADLSLAWHTMSVTRRRQAFVLMLNLLRVTRGGRSFLREIRGSRVWPEEPRFEPKATVALALLDHGAGSVVEPLAWERFHRLLGREEAVRLNVAGPLPIGKLADAGARVAVLSGLGKLALGDEDRASLKRFVEGGGTLVVEAVGGSEAFATSGKALVEELFGKGNLEKLPPTHELFGEKGLEVEGGRLYTFGTMIRKSPEAAKVPGLLGVTVGGRVAVIFSADDLTEGLLDATPRDVVGYCPEAAWQIMRDIVLYAARSR